MPTQTPTQAKPMPRKVYGVLDEKNGSVTTYNTLSRASRIAAAKSKRHTVAVFELKETLTVERPVKVVNRNRA